MRLGDIIIIILRLGSGILGYNINFEISWYDVSLFLFVLV